AHPDDECITTGGTLAKAADEGHRVVLVYATRGEVGAAPEGLRAPGARLVDRRVADGTRAADVRGARRGRVPGYRDSDVGAAAERLAALLREEAADVLLVYDEHGNYGHPDHVQVHRVGVAAAALAGTPQVLEATMSREAARDFLAQAVASGEVAAEDVPDVDDPDQPFGTPDALITTRVDVRPWAERKRAAMAAHESQ